MWCRPSSSSPSFWASPWSGVERRQRLLDILQVARDAISAATRFVTRLTPFGLFAIAANAAGTLGLEQLDRLQIYLVAYVAMALIVSLWVLPGLVAVLTPIRARDVLGESRDALITAFIAGDLFIVLPGLMHASRTLLDRLRPGEEEPGRLTEVIVPTSFNFPHTGKLLSLSFVLFAGWFADAPVTLSDYPQLALAGLVTFFGSLTAAVPFLLDQFRIPADTFQLFLATGVVNSRVGSLVAAVHTLTVALLVACAVTGHLRLRRGPFLSYVGLTAALVIVVLGGTRVLFATGLSTEYSKDKVLASMQLLHEPVDATVARTPSPRHRPRTCRRSRLSTSARCCASGTCPTHYPSRSSMTAERWLASTSSSRIAWHERWASPSPSFPSIVNGWWSNSRRGTATW